MGVIAPEGAVDWIDRELEILPTRPQDRFNISAGQIRELREEVFPYWRGQTLEDTVAARVPEDVRLAVAGKAFSLNQTDHAQGHILPDVETWLRLGIAGLRDKLIVAQQRPDVQDEAQQYYEASHIALQATGEFITRYADLATNLAEETGNETRRAELRGISSTCRHLAEQPARTFHEALQATWFLFVLLQIESNASSFSPGRFDQYMLPYLQQDLQSGQLTLNEAQELLG